jgi:hypothetical protein
VHCWMDAFRRQTSGALAYAAWAHFAVGRLFVRRQGEVLALDLLGVWAFALLCQNLLRQIEGLAQGGQHFVREIGTVEDVAGWQQRPAALCSNQGAAALAISSLGGGAGGVGWGTG